MGNYPSHGIQRKFKTVLSADNTAITTAATITVPSGAFGILWKLWLGLDVTDTTDIQALVDPLALQVTIGSVVWAPYIHPYIAHATNQDHIDLGPWEFDFGVDGLYSGVSGNDITFVVGAAGSGIKAKIDYIYAGD